MDLFNILLNNLNERKEGNIFDVIYWRDSQESLDLYLFFDLLNFARMSRRRKAVRLSVQSAVELFSLVNKFRSGLGAISFEECFNLWKQDRKHSFVHITFEDALKASNQSAALLKSANELFAPSKC